MVGGRITAYLSLKDVRWFSAALSLFLIHQLTQYSGWHWVPADHYLDPFLAVPVMLGAALLIIRLIRPAEQFHPITTGLFSAGLILFFETGWFTREGLYSDPVDAFFYAAGALVFQMTINRIPNPEVTPR